MASRVLSAWDDLIGSAAAVAIIILALCVMVAVVKREDALRHLGLVIGAVILLTILPSIVLELWNALSFRQQFGFVAVCIAILLLVNAIRRISSSARRK